jgi:phage shock protein A
MAVATLESIGDHLKRLLDGQRLLSESVEDVKQRLNRVERVVVELHGNVVRIDHRLDRVEERLARIERRLDLVEA